MSRRPRKRILVLATVVLALALCLLALPGLAGATTPDAYLIDDVPFYQQIQSVGCGAAATQMVLDYWGPFVNQKSVYDAARTFHGSSLPDLARAGQFSALSYSAGDRYPAAEGWGYASRPLGYGGFYYAQPTPWLAQLKAVLAQGYPVICLTDWLPGVYGPHYRVAVGYDDAEGVIILNDPWGRELKGDFDYQGSGNQNAAYDRQGEFVGWKWSYADFLSVWKLPSDGWGVPGANYGAVLIAPWQVQVDAPSSRGGWRIVHGAGHRDLPVRGSVRDRRLPGLPRRRLPGAGRSARGLHRRPGFSRHDGGRRDQDRGGPDRRRREGRHLRHRGDRKRPRLRVAWHLAQLPCLRVPGRRSAAPPQTRCASRSDEACQPVRDAAAAADGHG